MLSDVACLFSDIGCFYAKFLSVSLKLLSRSLTHFDSLTDFWMSEFYGNDVAVSSSSVSGRPWLLPG